MNTDDFHEQLLSSVLTNHEEDIGTNLVSGGTAHLLEKHTEVKLAKDALLSSHDTSRDLARFLDERKGVLAEKREELEKSRKVFLSYIDANEAKEQAAHQRKEAAKRDCKTLEGQIEELKEKVKELQKEQHLKGQTLERYKGYQRTLQVFVDQSNDFKDVGAVIDRWNMLQSARDKLTKRARKATKGADTENAALLQSREDLANLKLSLNNSNAKKQNKLERLRDGVYNAELLQGERHAQKVSKMTEYVEIQQAVSSILKQCDARSFKSKKVSRVDLPVEEKLAIIGRQLGEMMDLVKALRA